MPPAPRWCTEDIRRPVRTRSRAAAPTRSHPEPPGPVPPTNRLRARPARLSQPKTQGGRAARMPNPREKSATALRTPHPARRALRLRAVPGSETPALRHSDAGNSIREINPRNRMMAPIMARVNAGVWPDLSEPFMVATSLSILAMRSSTGSGMAVLPANAVVSDGTGCLQSVTRDFRSQNIITIEIYDPDRPK